MKNKNNLFVIIIIVLIIIIAFELIYFGKSNSNIPNTTADSNNSSLNSSIGKTYGESVWLLKINSTTWQTINGKSNLVINLTFECKEKHKQCGYENNMIIKNKNDETIGSLAYAKFESTISDSNDSSAYGGDIITGNFYIELEEQADIYISYLDSSDTSESVFGKTYKIKI